MGERKGNNSSPFLMVGMGSIQPKAICDPTKSPGAGQLGSTVVKEYKVGSGGEGETEWFVGWGER